MKMMISKEERLVNKIIDKTNRDGRYKARVCGALTRYVFVDGTTINIRKRFLYSLKLEVDNDKIRYYYDTKKELDDEELEVLRYIERITGKQIGLYDYKDITFAGR